ncbi:hypothetical protein KUF85_10335 [Streptococcus equi subsp. zooepidemicus]|uniref:hypothetical protein n=1 Tax=Streptococcus equi TaxID=1336 RepID=UPI001E3D1858|nr:hypothetical protein [Streptococcus equi]MCD3420512.1 hypothetical protein [Streptococcus equi subsp. zooepidemicus]
MSKQAAFFKRLHLGFYEPLELVVGDIHWNQSLLSQQKQALGAFALLEGPFSLQRLTVPAKG